MKSKNMNSLSTEIRRNNMDEPRVYPTERITVPWEYYVMLARLVPIDVTKFDRLVRSLARQGCVSNKQMISTSFEELTYDLKEPEFVSIDEFHTSIPSPCYELTFGNIINMNTDDCICNLRSDTNDKSSKRRKTNGEVKRS